MKKSIAALLAAACLLAPIATVHPVVAAPQQKDIHRPTVHRGSWTRGHRLSPSDRKRAEALDYTQYRLKTPPRGYRWMRIGNSFLMVGMTSGLILSVVAAR